MKKFNFKSRKGFTLIELLVVIGILAVLAAIAIPSVAGLIDRANQSADNTNASEMANAMERFISEYELYKQDIASGTLKDGDGDGVPDNMDAAQGRVFNVTKAVTRADIEELESKYGFNGVRIDIDNKYPQNQTTAKAVIQNYMKTNSSTFEPKQSDKVYWYNTLTGYTVVAEENINTATLQDLLPSDIRYGNSQEGSMTEWINLSSTAFIPDITSTTMSYYTGERSGTEVEGIKFDFEIPNPKYYDVDYNKIHILRGYANALLDINNYGKIFNFNELIQSGKVADVNSDEDKLAYTFFLYTPMNSRPSDELTSFRIAYEYEEKGQIKYAYTPTILVSYDMVK